MLLLPFNAIAEHSNFNDAFGMQIDKKANPRLEPFEKLNIYSHKHVLKFSIAYSSTICKTTNTISRFEGYSINFNYHTYDPVYSFSHEFYLDNIFSMSYSLGFVSSKMNLNNVKIQSKQAFLFVHPKLNILRRPNFEIYSQLNVGVVYNDMDRGKIKSETLRHFLPPTFKLYTGFTPIGINLRITDQIWLSSEASIWSYERFNVGIKFKLKENLSHPNSWVGIN